MLKKIIVSIATGVVICSSYVIAANNDVVNIKNVESNLPSNNLVMSFTETTDYVQYLDERGIPASTQPSAPYNTETGEYEDDYQPLRNYGIYRSNEKDVLYFRRGSTNKDLSTDYIKQDSYTNGDTLEKTSTTLQKHSFSTSNNPRLINDSIFANVYDLSINNYEDGDEYLNVFVEESNGNYRLVVDVGTNGQERGSLDFDSSEAYHFLEVLDDNVPQPDDSYAKDKGSCGFIDIETADADLDGLDELLFVQYCGVVRIYKWRNLGTVYEYMGDLPNIIDSFQKDRVSIAVGDVDSDSYPEIVIAVSHSGKSNTHRDYIRSYNINMDSTIGGYFTRGTFGIQKADGSELHVKPFAISIGNIDGDSDNEVIVGGGKLNNDGSLTDTLTVAYFDPDFLSDKGKRFQNGSWGPQLYWWSVQLGKKNFSFQMYPEIDTWDPLGWGQNKLFVYGNTIFQYNLEPEGDGLLNKVGLLGDPAKSTAPLYSLAVGNLMQPYDIIYDEVSYDEMESNDLREEIFYQPYDSFADNGLKYCNKNGALAPYIYTLKNEFYDQYQYPQNINLSSKDDIFDAMAFTSSEQEEFAIACNLSEGELTYPRPVIGDYRAKSYKLTYEDRHDVSFTNPQIYAALAFPPAYENSTQFQSSYVEYRKQLSENSGSRTQWANGYSIQTGVKIAFTSYLEFYTSRGVTQMFEGAIATVESKGSSEAFRQTAQTNNETDDMLVYMVMPIDNYYYRIISAPDLELIGNTMVIERAREPILTATSVTHYNQLFSDEFDAFDKSLIWSHTIGDPRTYMSEPQFRAIEGEVDKIFTGSSQVTTTADTAIILDHENGTETSSGMTWSTSVVFGSSVLGATFDAGYTHSGNRSVFSGTSLAEAFTANVGGYSLSENLDDFNWGFFVRPMDYEGYEIIVGDYWVIP